MWNPIDGEMPAFWPPKPNWFWRRTLGPLRHFYLRSYYKIADITIDGLDRVQGRFDAGDGVLVAPNHSHDSDPHVMMQVARVAHRQFYFMAAWQIFKMHGGIDGWVLQRMGAFSVDREGCDRRAVRQAVELLSGGNGLVVFPEGEIYRLNGRLTPLLEGVAFMAISAQRDLDKAKEANRRVWIVPTAIRYKYVDDVMPKLIDAMTSLESRLMLTPQPDHELHLRILRLGETLLTIKEKEKLGHSCEIEGDVHARVTSLIEKLLSKREVEHLKESPSADTVPLRVKALRRHLIEIWTDEKSTPEAKKNARESLDDVQLALQLYSYPGDYVLEQPSVERMAETIEKFEEDITGFALPKGRRKARVIFGDPIDLKATTATRAKAASAEITEKLETAIRELMKNEA